MNILQKSMNTMTTLSLQIISRQNKLGVWLKINGKKYGKDLGYLMDYGPALSLMLNKIEYSVNNSGNMIKEI